MTLNNKLPSLSSSPLDSSLLGLSLLAEKASSSSESNPYSSADSKYKQNTGCKCNKNSYIYVTARSFLGN